MADDAAAVSNGRARWILSLALPILGSLFLMAVTYSIRQHDLFAAHQQLIEQINVVQNERLATLEIRQADVLRRLAFTEERLRTIELELASWRRRSGGDQR